jgi:hypothetical protein
MITIARSRGRTAADAGCNAESQHAPASASAAEDIFMPIDPFKQQILESRDF